MRALSDQEAAVLTKLVGSLESGAELARQLSGTRVRDDSTPTFLRLVTDDADGKAGFRDGPVPGRFPVVRDGKLIGELILWVSDGRLSGLEFAWVTDEAPLGMPDADEVQVAWV